MKSSTDSNQPSIDEERESLHQGYSECTRKPPTETVNTSCLSNPDKAQIDRVEARLKQLEKQQIAILEAVNALNTTINKLQAFSPF